MKKNCHSHMMTKRIHLRMERMVKNLYWTEVTDTFDQELKCYVELLGIQLTVNRPCRNQSIMFIPLITTHEQLRKVCSCPYDLQH